MAVKTTVATILNVSALKNADRSIEHWMPFRSSDVIRLSNSTKSQAQ
jgi:hypothetical protein